MRAVLDRLATGYVLHGRNVPSYNGRRAGARYWLMQPRCGRRIALDRITVEALMRRGLVALDQRELRP